MKEFDVLQFGDRETDSETFAKASFTLEKEEADKDTELSSPRPEDIDGFRRNDLQYVKLARLPTEAPQVRMVLPSSQDTSAPEKALEIQTVSVAHPLQTRPRPTPSQASRHRHVSYHGRPAVYLSAGPVSPPAPLHVDTGQYQESSVYHKRPLVTYPPAPPTAHLDESFCQEKGNVVSDEEFYSLPPPDLKPMDGKVAVGKLKDGKDRVTVEIATTKRPVTRPGIYAQQRSAYKETNRAYGGIIYKHNKMCKDATTDGGMEVPIVSSQHEKRYAYDKSHKAKDSRGRGVVIETSQSASPKHVRKHALQASREDLADVDLVSTDHKEPPEDLKTVGRSQQDSNSAGTREGSPHSDNLFSVGSDTHSDATNVSLRLSTEDEASTERSRKGLPRRRSVR